MDHGELNVPLSKRGDIDAQIDRYKAEQAAAANASAKAARAAFNAARSECLQIIVGLTDERVAEMAERTGCRANSVRKMLREAANTAPHIAIKALRRERAAS